MHVDVHKQDIIMNLPHICLLKCKFTRPIYFTFNERPVLRSPTGASSIPLSRCENQIGRAQLQCRNTKASVQNMKLSTMHGITRPYDVRYWPIQSHAFAFASSQAVKIVYKECDQRLHPQHFNHWHCATVSRKLEKCMFMRRLHDESIGWNMCERNC